MEGPYYHEKILKKVSKMMLMLRERYMSDKIEAFILNCSSCGDECLRKLCMIAETRR